MLPATQRTADGSAGMGPVTGGEMFARRRSVTTLGDGSTCQGADSPRRWLSNTPMLQHDHPRVRLQAQRLTQLKVSQADKAVACFQFVRSLPFKLCGYPAGVTALKVLDEGAGDCHTKGTLFVAILRSLGIPARIHLVALRPEFLHGLLNTDRLGVDHAFTEVYIDGCWHSVDAYVLDLKLGLAARSRLLREGRRFGYIVHMKGRVVWDGQSDALGHFSTDDPASLPIEDFGVFDDAHQFHTLHRASISSWASLVRCSIAAAIINRRIKALRESIAIDQPGSQGRSEGTN